MSTECANAITLVTVSAEVKAERFVELVGKNVQHVSASGGDADGVAGEAVEDGRMGAIAVFKLDGAKLNIECGAAVAEGDRIMSDAQGRGIVATGATARVLGKAITSTSAAGEFFTLVAGKASGEFVA